MATSKQKRALVLYPESQAYTTQALVKAFKKILPDWTVETSRSAEVLYDLQYADYDDIDWDAAEDSKTLVNSYMLRKVFKIHFVSIATSLTARYLGTDSEELPLYCRGSSACQAS